MNCTPDIPPTKSSARHGFMNSPTFVLVIQPYRLTSVSKRIREWVFLRSLCGQWLLVISLFTVRCGRIATPTGRSGGSIVGFLVRGLVVAIVRERTTTVTVVLIRRRASSSRRTDGWWKFAAAHASCIKLLHPVYFNTCAPLIGTQRSEAEVLQL